MECRWLGHKRWDGEDRLEEGPIRILLQGLQCWWVPVGGSIPCMCLHHDSKLVGSVWSLAPLWFPEDGFRLGGEEPCHLWLLQGHRKIPSNARGVFIESMGLMNYKRTHIPTTPFFFLCGLDIKWCIFYFMLLMYWDIGNLILFI